MSNRFAYGYGHMTVYSPPQQAVGVLGGESEEVAGVGLHTIPEPEAVYEATLRRVLGPGQGKKEDAEVEEDDGFAGGDEVAEKEEKRRPAVAILLSWKEPWRFLGLLRRWMQLLAKALLPPGAAPEDPLQVLKRYKISLSVIVQHVEAQEGLEREGYKEENFDYISQCLRTCILPLSAALVYTSSNPPPQQPGAALTEVQKVVYTGLGLDLAPLSPAPAKGTAPTKREDLGPRHNVVDRAAIVVPSGWDSVGKIRLLSETFSPETLMESWMLDLNTPDRPPTPPKAPAPETTEATTTDSVQTNGDARKDSQPEAEVYATSDAGSDEPSELHAPSSPNPSLSAVQTYESLVPNPTAHKAPQQPTITVTDTPTQTFLAEMRAHLQELEAADARRANNNPQGPTVSTTAGSAASLNSSSAGNTSGAGSGRMIGLPSGEQTGALTDLGEVSFNVGGVSYNTVTAEAAIERIKRPSHLESPTSTSTPRNITPRPPRRGGEERETVTSPTSSAAPGSKEALPVEKLEEYFASLMKKGSGTPASSAAPGAPGSSSAGSTPSKPPSKG
jgi:dynein light intermediate chain 1, cytosolic